MKQGLFWILLSGSILFLSADSKNPFAQQEIYLDRKADGIHVLDLNYDGYPDLAALTAGTGGVFLEVFLSDSGFIPPERELEIPIPDGTVMWCFGEVDPTNQNMEVLVTSRDAISIITLSEPLSPVKIASNRSPFSFLANTGAAFKNFCIDLEEDGISEILRFGADTLHVLARSDAGFKESVTIRFPRLIKLYSRNQTETNQFQVVMGEVFFRDFNNDSKKDLIITVDGDTRIYLQTSQGFGNPSESGNEPNFSTDLRITNVIEDEETGVGTTEQFFRALTRVRVTDLNADGFCDFIVTKIDARHFFSGVGQVQVYLNKNGFLPNVPDDILITRSYTSEYKTADLNRDGLKDLIVLNESVSTWATIKFLAVKRMNARYSCFLLRPDGKFDEAPYRFSFSVGVDLSNLQRQAVSSNFESDFNGDGLSDVICQNSDGFYSIYLGDSKGLFEKEFEVPTPISAALVCSDLDLDGTTEFLTFHNNLSGSLVRIHHFEQTRKN